MNISKNQRIKILLADDHGIVRHGLRRILEDEGDMEVLGEASNGRECVKLAEQIRPDIILMDISMPDLNGTEATRMIRDRCPSTRVLILSMHHTAEYVFRALKAGAAGYVLKKSLGQEVIEAIRAVQSGKRYLSAGITEVIIDDYVAYRYIGDGESPLKQLSSREREVLQMVAEGYSSAAIGESLHLSPKTVETYRSRMMQKLSIDNIPALVKFAIQCGITSLE